MIARLQEDLSHRTEQLDRTLKKLKELEAACTSLTDRLAETTAIKVLREIRDGNHNKAHYAAQDWLEHEGKPISTILRFEAEWATTHAAGDAHLAGFIVAEAFASAAHSMWPQDKGAAELRTYCDSAQIENRPSFRNVLAILTNVDPNRLFNAQLVDWALELEREALTLESRGFFRLALLQIERAVAILQQELGAEAHPSLRARTMRVRLLLWVGKPHDALVDIGDIAAAFARAVGPKHPNTLTSRYLLAEVLGALGHSAEALPILEDVAAKETASPDLGPKHPNTLTSRFSLAEMLDTLGRTAEALPILEDVAAKQSASPHLGPEHSHTLKCRFSLAQVLDVLGRPAEALTILEDVAAKETANSNLGPKHRHTLASRSLLAEVLDRLGRTAEALPFIEDVVAKETADPDLGPEHPSTLTSQHLLAWVLNRLGRTAEALPIIEDVAAKKTATPDFGPKHRHTLASRSLLADVLDRLGRTAEALPFIEGAVTLISPADRVETSSEGIPVRHKTC